MLEKDNFMKGILNIFKKNGGASLIKKYFYNHIFLYAITLFLFLPKNKTGLELFREAINLKVYNRIYKKYKKYLSLIDENNNEDVSIPKTVWFCWFQGLLQAPDLVKVCYETIKRNCKDFKIIVVDKNNFNKYANIPEIILEKWNKGIITNTHFSDILRTALLLKNGGIWIDATVLLTESIPAEILDSKLFLFETYKPGRDGKAYNISSWFIASCPNSIVFQQVMILLTKYWERNNYLCDYFLFHIFVQIVLDAYPEINNSIPKYTNETPHYLLFELGKKFDETNFDYLTKKSFCHKLTYKLEESKKSNKSNYYNWILENMR